mgnify:CR=1 FL=1
MLSLRCVILGIITDLYVDFYKFKGANVKSRLARLREVLDGYSYDALVQFFRPEVSK